MIDWENLTWRCHICGEERPDAQISVHKRERTKFITENIRYCNDRPACAEGALTYSHFPPDQ